MRGLILIGLPMFDLVHLLGTMVVGHRAELWLWWPVGMTLHAIVGAIWAIFYAYFFWSFYDLPPTVQGIVFSLLPAVLAGLVMVPQIDYMIVPSPQFRTFALGAGWFGPASIILGHLIYGAVLGSLYTRPVGFPTGRPIKWHA